MIVTPIPSPVPPGVSKKKFWGDQLWDNLYPVKVRYIASIPENIMRDFGVPTCGDKALDRQGREEMINIIIPISDILEYYRKGERVIWRHHPDLNEVYSIITNYLTAWNQELSEGLNSADVPMQDLRDLDQMAASVFTLAQTYGTQPRQRLSFLDQLFGGKGRVTTRESLQGGLARQVEATTEPRKPTEAKHQSQIEALVKSVARLKHPWSNN